MRADRQTDRQTTDILITILRAPLGDEVVKYMIQVKVKDAIPHYE